MFDAAVVMGPLPEGSFFALSAEHGDRIVRDEDFAECYSGRRGICGGRWVKKLIDAVTAVDQGAGGGGSGPSASGC